MNRHDFVELLGELLGLAAVAAIAWVLWLLVCTMWHYNDPDVKAERARRFYEYHYPCINGIRYIKSYKGVHTVMIDPATDKPQHCGAGR